jgi:hypothetical protein
MNGAEGMTTMLHVSTLTAELVSFRLRPLLPRAPSVPTTAGRSERLGR